MIVEFGHFALLLSVADALYQFVVPLYGAQVGEERLMRTATPAANAQFVLVFISFLALTYAYVTSDFSVENVVRNSHSEKPLI